MVSWFHLFKFQWASFEDVIRSKDDDSNYTAFLAGFERQASFENLKNEEGRVEASKTWLKDGSGGPGVVLIIRGKKGGEGRGLIDVVHHLEFWSDEDNQPCVLGLSNFDSSARAVAIDLEELFDELVPQKKMALASLKDRFVPSIEGLISGRHKIRERFVPQMFEDIPQINSLSGRPRGVYLPFPLWSLLWTKMEDSEDEFDVEGPNQPSFMLSKLVEGLELLLENDKSTFSLWEPHAQRLVDFLWVAANELSPGVSVHQVDGAWEAIHFHRKCFRTLIDFHRRLGEAFGDAEEESHTSSVDPVQGGVAEARDRGDSADGKKSKKKGRLGVKDDEAEAEETATEDSLPPPPLGVARPPGDPLTQQGLPQEVSDWTSALLAGFLSSAKALESAGISLKEFATVNKESVEKKECQTKATSKWLPSAVFLLRILSAEEGWATEGLPNLSEFAHQLVDMKISQATQLVRAKAKEESWCGCILKSGLGDFLKRGFVAEDVNVAPSGFSVLFFHPSCFTETDSDEFNAQHLKETFGDGKISDDLIRALNKMQIYVPASTYEAADQLRAAISFLECVCGPKTIATGGYKRGLAIMEARRPRFEAETSTDKFFLLNYLYMMDRVFQSFCESILPYINQQDPIIFFAETKRADYMELLVDDPMDKWFVQGMKLSFQSPLILAGRGSLEGVVELNGPGKRKSSGEGEGRAISTKGAKKRSTSEEDELAKEDYVHDWKLPPGKRMSHFFAPHMKANIAGVPSVPHHHTGRPTAVCLRYQLENGPKCKRGKGCLLAHIRPSDMSPEAYDALSSHLKRVYTSVSA
jgi:hypothetical protein